MIQVGDVALVDDLPDGREEGLRRDLRGASSPTTSTTRSSKVRKGDADVAIEMQGDTLVAHYTQTDQVKAAVTAGRPPRLRRRHQRRPLSAAAGQEPTYDLRTERVEDDSLKTIQFYTPGLLGWAVAMSASFGAAATLQGWRQSKLLRRLQLAPVSTRTVVGARVAVTSASRWCRWRSSSGSAAAVFGLTLTGSWWMAIPLLVVGTLCFMSIGLLAGAMTKTTEGAVNAANFMVLPMAFLAGSFFPLDAAPGWLQALLEPAPAQAPQRRDARRDGPRRGTAAALVPMAILAAFAVVVTLVAARLFRWETT